MPENPLKVKKVRKMKNKNYDFELGNNMSEPNFVYSESYVL